MFSLGISLVSHNFNLVYVMFLPLMATLVSGRSVQRLSLSSQKLTSLESMALSVALGNAKQGQSNCHLHGQSHVHDNNHYSGFANCHSRSLRTPTTTSMRPQPRP